MQLALRSRIAHAPIEPKRRPQRPPLLHLGRGTPHTHAFAATSHGATAARSLRYESDSAFDVVEIFVEVSVRRGLRGSCFARLVDDALQRVRELVEAIA